MHTLAAERDPEDDEDEESDTVASRFTAKILSWLMYGFMAKDKNVRYRVLQTVAEMVSHLGEIEYVLNVFPCTHSPHSCSEDAYKTLRAALLDRINDREISVRCQAVMSLAKLGISEDQDFDEEVSIVEVLLDALAYDPSMYVLYLQIVNLFPSPFSSDVRRTALLAIPINPQTLPRVLERTMDTDITIRKLLYSAVLDKSTTVVGEDGVKTFGPTHPRVLSIVQREVIIRNGLGDRDHQVRASAASLLETWVDFVDMKAEDKDVKVDEQIQEKMQTGVLSLLALFDLHEGTVAENALLSIFKSRVNIFDTIDFDGKNSYFHVVLCSSTSSIPQGIIGLL